jgi:hypothetical protein
MPGGPLARIPLAVDVPLASDLPLNTALTTP